MSIAVVGRSLSAGITPAAVGDISIIGPVDIIGDATGNTRSFVGLPNSGIGFPTLVAATAVGGVGRDRAMNDGGRVGFSEFSSRCSFAIVSPADVVSIAQPAKFIADRVGTSANRTGCLHGFYEGHLAQARVAWTWARART